MCRHSYENELDYIPKFQVEETLESDDLFLVRRCQNEGISDRTIDVRGSISRFKSKNEEKGYVKCDIQEDLFPIIGIPNDHRELILRKYDRFNTINPMAGPNDGYETERIH
jgi:hypothetical protein